MASRAARTEKLDLRPTPEAKRRLFAAAEASRIARRATSLVSALERAEETLADRRMFWNAKQWAAFQAALDAPPMVIPELKRLLERKAPWE